jgi:hypothetical protein
MSKKTKTRTPINIIEACQDKKLFAGWFKDPQTWRVWFVFLKVVFGLSLDAEEFEIFKQCTGRDQLPDQEFTTAYMACGRRSGKSLMMALCAVWLACLNDWTPYLAPGERATIMVISADRKAARTVMRYAGALLKNTMLRELIVRETADTFDLSNNTTIEITSASYRTVRSYSVAAALCDEIAFWRNDEDGANPDKEIIAALKPAMATIPGSKILIASSPYSRRGVLWDSYRKHYGKQSDELFWKAPTLTMNPTVPRNIIDAAYEDDPASAAAEYGAEFRSDLESFVTREAIAACTVSNRLELLPVNGQRYVAFCDPSGGSSDSMTLAVAHRDEWSEKAILDAVREVKPPFSPETVVAEFAALLRKYDLKRVIGDHYAGEWPRERFRFHGITYETSSRSKS